MRSYGAAMLAAASLLSGCASLEVRTEGSSPVREAVIQESAPMLVAVKGAQPVDGVTPTRCVKVVRLQRSQDTTSRYEASGVGEGFAAAGLLAGAGLLMLGGAEALESAPRGAPPRPDPVLTAIGEVTMASGAAVAHHTGAVVDQSLWYPPVHGTSISYSTRVVELDQRACEPDAPAAPATPRFLKPSQKITRAEALKRSIDHISPRIVGCETTFSETQYSGGKRRTRAQHCAGEPGRLMGTSYVYYGDGESIKEITTYIDGAREGHWFEFDFMGQLKGEAFYRDGMLADPSTPALSEELAAPPTGEEGGGICK